MGGLRVVRRHAVSSIVQLAETILDEGSRSPNWFNGRLVTAEAMKQERKAVRESLRSLGRIAGGGVAFGLEVVDAVGLSTPTRPVVTIKAGMAVDARGHLLRLCDDAAISLLTVRSSEPATGNGFTACTRAEPGVYVAGEGVYLLVLSPAAAKQGRAVASGLGNAPVSCDAAYVIDGVAFRLVPVPLTQAVLDDVAHLRNLLAYRFFAVESAAARLTDPFGLAPASENPLVALTTTKAIDDCDVPLAVVYWTAAGLQFIDMWSVRRQLMPGRPRRQVEAHAMCAQFERHLADLLAAEPSPSTTVATDHFRYLPPFGAVPLQRAPRRGFLEPSFFANVVRRPASGSGQATPFIDGRLIDTLAEQALAHAPIDLTQKEFIWVYRPWQNVKAVLEGRPVQPMVVFASGLMPDLAIARFDMARADFSDFANCCGGS
jgi:hypothetical protein